MQEISVPLQDRRYSIHIGRGLLKKAGALIAPFLARRRVMILSESKIMAMHGNNLLASLKAADISAEIHETTQEGEALKNFASLQNLCEALLDAEMERSDSLVILGGGALGDVGALAANLVRRGIGLIQIPTTLLAQVDSSVGGKTAINMKQGKNLVGSFYQPRLVLADLELLETLEAREMRCGYAEIVKYGLLGDADFFAWLEEHGAKALAWEEEALLHAVATSCRMKAEIVARDERESGRRALLNLGHSFAHALESFAEHSDRLRHGEAVAIGLVCAAELSHKMGFCKSDVAPRVERLLQKAGLPTRIRALEPTPKAQALLRIMKQDKKREGGKMRLVLLNKIGDSFIRTLEDESDLVAILKDCGCS